MSCEETRAFTIQDLIVRLYLGYYKVNKSIYQAPKIYDCAVKNLKLTRTAQNQ